MYTNKSTGGRENDAAGDNGSDKIVGALQLKGQWQKGRRGDLGLAAGHRVGWSLNNWKERYVCRYMICEYKVTDINIFEFLPGRFVIHLLWGFFLLFIFRS